MYKNEPIELTDLGRHVIKRIEDIGRAKEMLKNIISNPIFDELSKHDEWWHSVHAEEGEKLDELRRTFICIQDDLWNMQSVLDPD